MPERVEGVDELKIHVKNRDFHALSRLLQNIQPSEFQPGDSGGQSLARPDLLMEELEIQIEDLKNEAVRRFDKEEFADCVETFEFLIKVNPNDRSLKDYLELCKECVEQQAVSEPHRVADSFAQIEVGVRAESSARQEGIEQSHEFIRSGALVGRSVESQSTELTRRMRVYFDNRDFEALKRVVKEALRIDAKESVTDSARQRIDGSRLEEAQQGRNSRHYPDAKGRGRRTISRAQPTANAWGPSDSFVIWSLPILTSDATWKDVSSPLRNKCLLAKAG
jgi:hypothetical protein